MDLRNFRLPFATIPVPSFNLTHKVKCQSFGLRQYQYLLLTDLNLYFDVPAVGSLMFLVRCIFRSVHNCNFYLPPLLCLRPIGGDIQQCFCLTSVCLSRTSGLSREHTCHRKTKIGTGEATSHVTLTSFSRSKGQSSRSPGRFTHCGLNASGSCSGQRANVFGVGNYRYVAVCSAALGASAPTEGGEGRGHIVTAARLQLIHLRFN